MGEKLYPNAKKITNLFCLAIVLLTVALFTLRLTAFRQMVEEPAIPEPEPEVVDVEGTTIAYRLRTQIHFDSPDALGDIAIENDAKNSYYLRLEIIYDIGGRSVYLSPFLKPGDAINSGYLQGGHLFSGEYKCSAVITAYDPLTRQELQSHSQPITIIIG